MMRKVRILAWTAFALLNVLYLIACLQRTAVPGVIFNDLQRDIGLLGSQVTGLGSAYLYVYACSQVFAGILVDRFGGKRMGILGGILIAAGLVVFSTAKTPFMLYAGRVLSALGQSFIYLCVVKIAHLFFSPRQFGSLIGISMAIGFCGSIAGTLPMQRYAQFAGWRSAFLVIGLVCAASAVATAIVLKPMRERPKVSSAVTWQSFCDLFNERGRFNFVTFHFWSYPAYFVMQAILGQKFIQDYIGLSATKASMFTMSLTLGSVIFCLVGGPLMKALGGRRKPLVYVSVALPPLSALVMALGIHCSFPSWVFLVCFASISLAQISAASTSALMSEINDTHTIAFSAAVRNFFPYVGSALVGGICGRILDHFVGVKDAGGVIHYPGTAYIWILGVMFLFGFIGIISAMMIPETYGKHIFKRKAAANV